MHLRKYILVYTILPLLILTASATYYRFVVSLDYRVSYEGRCDPLENNCFVGCEDDECTSEYYYTLVERYAKDLYNLCGEDISECEMADTCTSQESNCVISYCDLHSNDDDCETLTEVFPGDSTKLNNS